MTEPTTGANALDVLAPFHSWQLNRVSFTTYLPDIVVTAKRKGAPLSAEEAAALVKLMQAGTCYRCRIGKGRFYFGSTPLEAAQQAVAAETAKQPTNEEGSK